MAHFRNVNGISAAGKNIPEPVREFVELKEQYNVDEKIINNLKSCGYKKPTPVQMQIIPAMLSVRLIINYILSPSTYMWNNFSFLFKDRGVLACAPTGSGKTAAFLVPILAKLQKPSRQGFRVLILCPTRELSKQILRYN